jgi:hypothetical protein
VSSDRSSLSHQSPTNLRLPHISLVFCEIPRISCSLHSTRQLVRLSLKERRIRFVEHSEPHRKSGMWDTTALNLRDSTAQALPRKKTQFRQVCFLIGKHYIPPRISAHYSVFRPRMLLSNRTAHSLMILRHDNPGHIFGSRPGFCCCCRGQLAS